jgi:hypothetical protein
MDSKEQALEKADLIVSLLADGCISRIYENDNGENIVRVNIMGRYCIAKFPYAPPREAPAPQTMVEVWRDSFDHRRVRWSCGRLDSDGELVTQDEQELVGPISFWPNWRVVGEQSDVFTTANICGDCKHRTKESCMEPCVSCMMSTPTNYEAVK